VTDRLLNLTEFCLVWGPLDLPEPAYSFADDWVSQIYTPEEIAETILTVPGVRLTNPATPRWQGWAARWQEANRYIDFTIIPWEIDPDNELRPGVALAWGGSMFEMHCLLSDVLFVWQRIRQRCPAVWLHDTDCRMYSPESFAKKFAG
jgi:hypothetical protein